MDDLGDNLKAPVGVNPGFALGQLMKAHATAESHPDEGTRLNASKKIQNWLQVLLGMQDGSLSIGSRTPVSEIPAWVTTEVIYGGFVTGNLPGEGPLRDHERRLLERLGAQESGAAARRTITNHFLGNEGFRELAQMLEAGNYRLEISEEGALLAAVWLARAGEPQAAEGLLTELRPFLGRLRFYPAPAAQPFSLEGAMHMNSVAEARDKLAAMQPRPRVLQQRQTNLEWLPLYDRIVQLFVETLEGPPPSVQLDADSRPIRRADDTLAIEGGWPCRVFPQGWHERAKLLLQAHQRLAREVPGTKRLTRPGSNLSNLVAALERCLGGSLTEGQVSQVRGILALIAAKRGLPDSTRCRALRAEQAQVASLPDRHELATVAMRRLEPFASDDGLDAPDDLLGPVTQGEAQTLGMPEGAELAPTIQATIRRCRNGSLEQLLAWGLIPSSEKLAVLIPALTARVLAGPIADPELQRLYGATYLAFRRRRSVLLLDYEKQVQFEELPWIRRLEPYAAGTASGHAKEVLRQVTWAALTAFPQTILPNPLVRELSALAAAAGMTVPLVEELAADIFMGGFTNKFLEAARGAGALLQGTLYERYYGINYGEVARLEASSGQSPVSEQFSRLCSRRARGSEAGGWGVAQNGTIIEQAQILTTHNLAALIVSLDLIDDVTTHADDLSKRCFEWVLRTVRRNDGPWQVRLRRVKNAAYAWRQMIFFLSMVETRRQEAFLVWAEAHVREEAPDLQRRFAPAMDGLIDAIHGRAVPVGPGGQVDSEKCFLGWTVDRHWLLSSSGR